MRYMLFVVLMVILTACRNPLQEITEQLEQQDVNTIQQSSEEGNTGEANMTSEGSTTFKLVVVGYDWGPAISQVIIEFAEAFDRNAMAVNDYKVMTRYGEREVTDISYDDVNDRTVILSLKVEPDQAASAYYMFNMITGRNEAAGNAHEIFYKDMHLTDDEMMGYIKPITDDFHHNQTISYEDIELYYADWLPEGYELQPEGTVPLIIWLHGAGEGGKDTELPLLGNKVVNLATDEIQQYFGETGAAILTPQSPTMWMDYNGHGLYNVAVPNSDGASYYTEALMQLITTYVDGSPQVDRNRIYLGGCSNGGYMTVKLCIEYPDYFAAAYPVCQFFETRWQTQERINRLKDTPILLTHSRNDSTVPYTVSEELYNSLNEAGAEEVHLTLFDNVVDVTGEYFSEDGVSPYNYNGHFSWIYVLNNDVSTQIDGKEISLFEWLSKQSK